MLSIVGVGVTIDVMRGSQKKKDRVVIVSASSAAKFNPECNRNRSFEQTFSVHENGA